MEERNDGVKACIGWQYLLSKIVFDSADFSLERGNFLRSGFFFFQQRLLYHSIELHFKHSCPISQTYVTIQRTPNSEIYIL